MKFLKTILLSVGITSLLVCSINSYASGRTIDESLKVVEGGQLRFKILDGDVDFIVWDKQIVKVTGKLTDNNQELVFYNDGTDTVIKIESEKGYYNRSKHSWSSSDNEFKVYMPATTMLIAQSTSGDFAVDGLKAGVKAKNVSGDITIVNSGSTIEALTDAALRKLARFPWHLPPLAMIGTRFAADQSLETCPFRRCRDQEQYGRPERP